MLKYIIIFIIVQLILLVPSFYIYRKAVVQLKIKKVKVTSLVLTLGMPLIYTLTFAFICYNIIDPNIRSRKFNKDEWVKSIESRYKMVNYLIDNKLLVNKTKGQVIELLGDAFTEDCWGGNTLCYVADDPDNYAPLDHYEFVIFFNNKGVVEKAEYLLI